MKEYSDIDSKFRYVTVAAMRAKQLLKGAKPKIKSKSKNLVRVAQEEVQQGLIEFEIIQNPVEEFLDTGDDMFIGEEIRAGAAIGEEALEDVEEVIEKTEEKTEAAVVTKKDVGEAVKESVKKKEAKSKSASPKKTKKK
ncbi:MAG: DNA-directed RNA polymerase subunit omega [Candidatus Aminicenantaceae bacterium]